MFLPDFRDRFTILEFFALQPKLVVANSGRLNGTTKELLGVDVHEFIIGDVGYIGSPNILVPRSRQCQSPMFELYNFKHFNTHMCVECAFGALKGV